MVLISLTVRIYPYHRRYLTIMTDNLSELPLQHLKIESEPEAENSSHETSDTTIKRRKSQNGQEFLQQKEAFKQGPPVQNMDWFDKLDLRQLEDASIKMDRGAVLHAAERAYYLKDYRKTLEILQITDKWKMNDKQRAEITNFRLAALDKSSQS
jgi:hypothetical protein